MHRIGWRSYARAQSVTGPVGKVQVTVSGIGICTVKQLQRRAIEQVNSSAARLLVEQVMHDVLGREGEELHTALLPSINQQIKLSCMCGMDAVQESMHAAAPRFRALRWQLGEGPLGEMTMPIPKDRQDRPVGLQHANESSMQAASGRRCQRACSCSSSVQGVKHAARGVWNSTLAFQDAHGDKVLHSGGS